MLMLRSNQKIRAAKEVVDLRLRDLAEYLGVAITISSGKAAIEVLAKSDSPELQNRIRGLEIAFPIVIHLVSKVEPEIG